MVSCATFGGRKSPQDSKCSISAHINSLDSNPRCRNWCLVVVVCCYLLSPWLNWSEYRLYLCRKRGVHCQGLFCLLMILLLWFTIYKYDIYEKYAHMQNRNSILAPSQTWDVLGLNRPVPYLAISCSTGLAGTTVRLPVEIQSRTCQEQVPCCFISSTMSLPVSLSLFFHLFYKCNIIIYYISLYRGF